MNEQDESKGGAIAYLLLALLVVGIVACVLVAADMR